MDEIAILQQIYDAYREAEDRDDKVEMARLQTLGDRVETMVKPAAQREAAIRRADYESMPAFQRGLIGTGQAFSDAGTALQQAGAFAMGDDQGMAELAAQQQNEGRLMAPAIDDTANLMGNVLGYGAMAAPGALGAGMATAGMGALPRAAAQAGVGALEAPLSIPSTSPQNYGFERMQLAGLGGLAGGAGETLLAGPGAAAARARSLLPEGAADVAPVASVPMGARSQALADAGIDMLPGQQRYMDTGEVSGLSSIEAGRKLQGSDLQRDLTLFDEEQGRQAAEAVRGLTGDYTAIGEQVGGRLGSEATARKEAADEAWSNFRNNYADEVVLEPAQRQGLLEDLQSILVKEDPNTLSNPARALNDYLSGQKAMGDNVFYTGVGLDNLRRDIRNIRSRFSNPEEQRLVDQVYRGVNDALADISGDSPAIQALRDATTASRRGFELTDTKGSALSEAVQGVLSGRVGPEKLLDKMLQGRGDNAVAVLRDVRNVMPEAYPQLLSALRQAALGKSVGKRVRDAGGIVDLKTQGGYKAVADTLLDFINSNNSLARELFSSDELAAISDLAGGIGALAPPRNIPNYSNTAGASEFLRKKTRDVPFLTGWLDEAAEGRLRSEVYGRPGSSQSRSVEILNDLLQEIETLEAPTGTGALAVPALATEER
jgi:hypothetical protein